MKDDEFLRYIMSAAEDDVLISSDQLNRLRQLDPKSRDRSCPFPPGRWYQVDPDGIRNAVARATEAVARAAQEGGR